MYNYFLQAPLILRPKCSTDELKKITKHTHYTKEKFVNKLLTLCNCLGWTMLQDYVLVQSQCEANRHQQSTWYNQTNNVGIKYTPTFSKLQFLVQYSNSQLTCCLDWVQIHISTVTDLGTKFRMMYEMIS